MKSIARLLTVACCLFAASTHAQFSGLGEGLVATPGRLDFGRTELGEVSSARFLVRPMDKANVQNVEVRIDSGRRSEFKLGRYNCPATFRRGTKCWVTVEFAPKEAHRARGRVVVSSNSGAVFVELRGTGVPRQ